MVARTSLRLAPTIQDTRNPMFVVSVRVIVTSKRQSFKDPTFQKVYYNDLLRSRIFKFEEALFSLLHSTCIAGEQCCSWQCWTLPHITPYPALLGQKHLFVRHEIEILLLQPIC